MASRSFDYDAIWLKAVAFINRALDDADDFEERAFWAACCLELLAKAALTKISPVLIADINTDGNSLLIAAGLHEDSSTFVSVQAKTVFKRCQSLAKQFVHTLIPPDPDPVDRARGVDLGSAGLPGYCAALTIGADGEEHLALLRYNAGEADYWPHDWSRVAPHEVIDDDI
jgi:hypothetical protein